MTSHIFMSTTPVVYRGSTRPILWRLWSDIDDATPRSLPTDAVAVMRISRNGATLLEKRSDEDELDGLVLHHGDATQTATITWTPTVAETRILLGRAVVEIEYLQDGEQKALLPRQSFIEFVKGDNADE